MTTATYHGVVRGGTVLLDDAARLPDGTEVLVTPTAGSDRRGDPVALLVALKAAPPVPTEWVEELEALIKEGRKPPTHPNPFADESENA